MLTIKSHALINYVDFVKIADIFYLPGRPEHRKALFAGPLH